MDILKPYKYINILGIWIPTFAIYIMWSNNKIIRYPTFAIYIIRWYPFINLSIYVSYAPKPYIIVKYKVL